MRSLIPDPRSLIPDVILVLVPFKSQAQRRKFAELLVKGEISPETYEEWNRETGGRLLPERVKKKRKKKAARPARKAKKSARRARKK
jgi:hypothetical protein